MIQKLEDLKSRLNEAQKFVLRIKSQHINKEKDKNIVVEFVKFYFSQVRSMFNETPELKILDGVMQELLRLTQARSLKSKYKERFKEIKKEIDSLYAFVVCNPLRKEHSLNSQSELILKTLRKINNSAALSLEQALLDLGLNKKSWRGTVIEFRESLRITLDKLAPDAEVTSQQGFKLEPNTHGPTMRQKALFIFKSRKLSKDETKLVSEAVNSIEEFSAKFIRSTYTQASLIGHAEQDVTKEDTLKVKKYVELALSELLALKS